MSAHPEPFDSSLTLRLSKDEHRAQDRFVEGCALRALCVLLLLVVVASACSGTTSIFRQYEYEEEIYLSLDGTATVNVNSSLAALNALRGTSFDAAPTARIDAGAIRAYYSSPITHVRRVSQSRRNGRRYVHLRVDVDDLRRLQEVAPFAWSTYDLRQDGNLFLYRQTVGAPAGKDTGTGWSGRELVAFRLHLPSKIRHQNTHREVRRGNILEWEQPLADRMRGVPLAFEANIDAQSILYRTLWLFGATFVAVALAFVVVIWWVMSRKPTGAAAS